MNDEKSERNAKQKANREWRTTNTQKRKTQGKKRTAQNEERNEARFRLCIFIVSHLVRSRMLHIATASRGIFSFSFSFFFVLILRKEKKHTHFFEFLWLRASERIYLHVVCVRERQWRPFSRNRFQ